MAKAIRKVRLTVSYRMCLGLLSLAVMSTIFILNDLASVAHLNGALKTSLAVKDYFGPPDRVFGRRVLVAMDTISSREKSNLKEIEERFVKKYDRPPDSAYNFNVTASDALSLDRSIPDTRPKPCAGVQYDVTSLPPVSIIIPFYNEALSMLLRTVHSILNRTPDVLLKEIILMDDASSYEYLKDSLQRYLRLLPKVKLIRCAQRQGLIKARLKGAAMATGEVLVFLDAHTECNVGWLEPLLAEILKQPNTIVQPFIDGLDPINTQYAQPRRIHRGAFSWDLRYVWLEFPEHTSQSVRDEGTTVWSPVLVGCAMAVNRTYFLSMGAFDDGMQIWGGENIELSFRTWMCGGRVLTVPCSRVGHMFRPVPYKDDVAWNPMWQKNLIRIADVWMDDYKQYFYASTRVYESRRVALSPEEKTSLGERHALRVKLKCRTFEWYLSNVIPEVPIPPLDAVYHGEIMNFKSQACWEVLDDGFIGIQFRCYEHKLMPENMFTLNKDGLLLYRDKCVKFIFPQPTLKVEECPERDRIAQHGVWSVDFKGQQWGYLKVSLDMEGHKNLYCVEQVTSVVPPHKELQMPQTATCEENNVFQIWSFTYRFDQRQT